MPKRSWLRVHMSFRGNTREKCKVIKLADFVFHGSSDNVESIRRLTIDSGWTTSNSAWAKDWIEEPTAPTNATLLVNSEFTRTCDF
eukprot:SAG31_NODE_13845_length_843_cov_0.889785_2_plen_86_part_00